MGKTKHDTETLKLKKIYPYEFKSWYNMIYRCYYPNCDVFHNYGGRGIRVCDQWKNSFRQFIIDMGRRPTPAKKFSLDRIDVNGNYCPENCRWADAKTQSTNKRVRKPDRIFTSLEYNGETRTLSEWSKIASIPEDLIFGRLQRNWTPERIFTTPTREERSKLVSLYKSEYNTWISMKERCLNPNNPSWPRYGGRGITIHEPWVSSFKLFIEYVGPKPTPQHSLDRINNDGNYEPGNVRWATDLEQVRNYRKNVRLTYKGETHCITEWAEIVGMDKDAFWSRIDRGWSIERAIEEAPGARSMTKTVTIGDITKTLAEWCREKDFSYAMVSFRINKLGMTPEEALTTEKKTLSDMGKVGGKNRWKNPRTLTYNGVTKTLSEWAKEVGLSYSSVLNRWRKGYPPEEILNPKKISFSEAGRKGCQQRWNKNQSSNQTEQ